MRRPFMFPPSHPPMPSMWQQPMMWQAQGGMFSRLFGSQLPTQAFGAQGALPSIDSMLTNVQKMLNMVQTITPMVQQYGPLIKSVPSMMRIFRELKQSDNINETTETANATSAATTEKQIEQKIPRKQRPVPTIKEQKKQQTDEKGKSVPKLYI
ncbi:VrrA/YqfQ family protein [Anoxybacillus sp. FSL W8-1294]|uniref:VrrA/YqfQ family protein n=1 Tax=Anoxybacillus sp. FSL W8-1294 TaxID=2954655 RepID=UPI0030CFC8DE